MDHSRVARGSLVGRRVARGSLILALVREKRGSRGDPLLGIYYYYTLLAGGRRPAPTNAGVPKKICARSLRGERGFEVLAPQTEKLSVRHSSCNTEALKGSHTGNVEENAQKTTLRTCQNYPESKKGQYCSGNVEENVQNQPKTILTTYENHPKWQMGYVWGTLRRFLGGFSFHVWPGLSRPDAPRHDFDRK